MSSTVAPFIGIDFGTSKSVITRYDAGTGRAWVIRNQEGREETPSVVYFGRSDSDIVVGGPAEMRLDAVQVDQSRFALSVKRDLLSAAPKILDDNRIYRPVDIAAKILGKLKDDAERLSFKGESVKRAVITCPASFDQLQQDKIKEAARLAGFEDVILLPEPIAAAIACSRSGLKVGKCILVYDFGGGTFDVAVLASNPYTTNSSFELASPPRGLKDCGGDDLDRKLYDYCEEIALRELHRRISLTNDFDMKFLHECRKRKENLSICDTTTFSNYLISSSDAVVFEHALQRATFEGRIRGYIDRTITMTQDVISDADSRQCRVDTVILIGGSSRVPMVMRCLTTSLPVQPQEWHERDFAVALGAAYHAQDIWGPKVYSNGSKGNETSDNDSDEDGSNQYRRALQDRWATTRRLTRMQVGELARLASRLGMRTEEVVAIEQRTIGNTKENILATYESALEQYCRTVAGIWKGEGLVLSEVAYLTGQTRMLNLSSEDAAEVERYVMGDPKEMVLSRTPSPGDQYRHALLDCWTATRRLTRAQVGELANLADRLGMSTENVAAIKQQVMDGIKRHQTGRKILSIFLFVIALFMIIIGGPLIVVGLLVMIVSIVLFVRKPKAQVLPPPPIIRH